MPVKVIVSKDDFLTTCKEAGDGKKVAIDFHAVWCGPCKVIGPKFEEMANQAEFSNIVFVKVDVDEVEDVAEKYSISAMPTFIIVDKDGKEVDKLVGANVQKLKDLLLKYA